MGSWFWTAALSSILAVVSLAGCATRRSLPVYSTVPDFALTDQNETDFHGAALSGHVWVADFFFTNCPGPCPRMSSQMGQVQTALSGSGVKLVSFTVDPARDTPRVLAEYARHFNADPAVWSFLTGPQQVLDHLGKDVFKLGAVDGSLEHSTRFVLIDKKSQVRGYYLTSEPEAIPRLIADARTLLSETP
jgi:protein SCO1/2